MIRSRVFTLRGTVPTPASKWSGWLAIILAMGVMLTMILGTAHRLASDEPWHRMAVYALHEQGFTVAYLRGLKSAAPGPLYALVQAAFEPLTGLQVPGIRLVSVFLSIGAALLLGLLLRSCGTLDPWSTAGGGLLAAPFGWPAYSMALTEPPALLLACAGLLLLAKACWREDTAPAGSGSRGIGLAIAGGFLLGAAVCGRQPFLVLLPALVLLAGPAGRGWRIALAAVVAMAVLPAALFAVWGGLTAPLMRWNAQGILPENLILGPAFTGIAALVLAPVFYTCLRHRRWGWSLVAAVVLLTIALNLIGGFYLRRPPRFAFGYHPPDLVRRAYGGVVLVMPILFFAALGLRAWEHRRERLYLFWTAAVGLIVLTPGRVPIGFDVRWLVTALPMLILITAPYAPPTFWRTGRWLAGMAMSAVLLGGGLRAHYAGDGSAPPPDLREMMIQSARNRALNPDSD